MSDNKPPFQLDKTARATMLRNLNPEDYDRLVQENQKLNATVYQMREQIQWYDRQNQSQSDISMILAIEIFRLKDTIADNLLQAPGHGPVRINGPLVHAVSQDQINKIEHLFPGSRPALGWSQQMDDKGIPHLVLEVKSAADLDAEHAQDKTLN
jgi:hypothetical protein